MVLDLKEMLTILLSAVLTENFVLVKFFGICPFLGVSKKIESAAGMSLAVTLVMVVAASLTWPLYHYVLLPNGLQYLDNIAFILIIALFVQLIEILTERFFPNLHKFLGVYLPLITTNCAVLGVTILNIDSDYSFWQSVFNALGGGLGFAVALLIFSVLREKLEGCDVPEMFKGLPAVLIAAAIFSLSFAGFKGVAENIFR